MPYLVPHMTTCCNTLQHSETHCNALQHTATHCNTLQHTAPHDKKSMCMTWVTRCRMRTNNTLQHTAAHYNILQHAATRCSTLQHAATCCTTLQHTALHCSTLHHTTCTLQMRQRDCFLPAQCHIHACDMTDSCVWNESAVFLARDKTFFECAATCCNTLQHSETRCNTLSMLQQAATRCNTLQHTATHCKMTQHTGIAIRYALSYGVNSGAIEKTVVALAAYLRSGYIYIYMYIYIYA